MTTVKEKNNRQILLIVILCVLIVLCAVLIYFIFLRSKEITINDSINNEKVSENQTIAEESDLNEMIDIEFLTKSKLDSLYETPSIPLDYQVGNKKPFEPFE